MDHRQRGHDRAAATARSLQRRGEYRNDVADRDADDCRQHLHRHAGRCLLVVCIHVSSNLQAHRCGERARSRSTHRRDATGPPRVTRVDYRPRGRDGQRQRYVHLHSRRQHGNVARIGTLTVGGKTVTVNQAATACSYTMSPTGQSLSAAGGSGTVAVTTTAGCNWIATNSAFGSRSQAPAARAPAVSCLQWHPIPRPSREPPSCRSRERVSSSLSRAHRARSR